MNRELALQAAQSASARAAALVHREMKRGLATLATIASAAAGLGLFATTLSMMSSFRGTAGPNSSIIVAIFRELSFAIIPTAFGLLVALAALWFYKYLLTEVESFDSEMKNATLDLVNTLGHLPAH